MVKQFILMILLCGVSSCYPPRIVYALDEMHSIRNNSIDYKKGHLLKLFLRFQDTLDNEIDKSLIFKSVKTKRFVYKSSR